MALPAAVAAQLVGPRACPDGVSENGPSFLAASAVKASIGGKAQATLGGQGLPITLGNINSTDGITGAWPTNFNRADMWLGVRDADGALVHGFYQHVGTVDRSGLTLRRQDTTFHNLEPSTKHVAQLVVGRLRNVTLGGDRDVTDDHVRDHCSKNCPGDPPYKTKPVFAQVCFMTPASGS